MIESPKNMLVARSPHNTSNINSNNGNGNSQLSKVVSKISDIFKIQQQYNLSKTNSLTKLTTKSNEFIAAHHHHHQTSNVTDDHLRQLQFEPNSIAIEIAEQLETTLREAKNKFFTPNTKILLPGNLALQIASDVINMSENEPCGIRGCVLYVNYVDRAGSCRRLGQINFGERTVVPTFEMYLQLKRNASGWLQIVTSRLLSHFGLETILISDCYKLSKKKLFRSLTNV